MLTVAESIALAAAEVLVSPRHDPVDAHATAIFIEVADASAQIVHSADYRHQARRGCGITDKRSAESSVWATRVDFWTKSLSEGPFEST